MTIETRLYVYVFASLAQVYQALLQCWDMEDARLDTLIKQYTPGSAARKAVTDAKLVLLVGITGAGKDTLKHHLLKDPSFYNFVSHTTRAPRSNNGIMEIDGEDYFFIDKTEAIRMLEDGEFIEAKRYSSNVYGTAIEGLKDSSNGVAVNDVEVQGVDEYKRLSADVMAIFILPPSADEWLHRLSKRYEEGTIDKNDMLLRKSTAIEELRYAKQKGYFEFLINDKIEDSVDALKRIVAGHRDPDEHEAGIRQAAKLIDDIGTH